MPERARPRSPARRASPAGWLGALAAPGLLPGLLLGLLLGCAPDPGPPPGAGSGPPTSSGAPAPDPADAEGPIRVTDAGHLALIPEELFPDVEPPELELPPLAENPLVRRLPPGTLAAGAVIGPTGLDRHLAIDRLFTAAGPWGEALRIRAQHLTGHDLSDVTTLRHLSIDPDHPIAAAVLDVDPMVVAIGWRSADIGVMRTLLHLTTAGRLPVREQSVGTATLLARHDGRGPTLGWQGDDVWVVFGDDLQPGESLYHAQRLAQHAGPAMADQPHIAEALERASPTPVALAVIDVPALVRRGLRTAAEDPKIERLRRGERADRSLEMYDAANRKASSRLRLESLDLFTSARAVARTQLIRAAAYPFGPAVFEVHLDESAAELRWIQSIAIGSLPARLLPTAPAAEAPLPMPLITPGALRLRLDTGVGYDWLKGLLVIADRGELAHFEAALRADSGVSLTRDLIEPFPGELAVHFTPDPDRPVESTGVPAALDLLRPVVQWRHTDGPGVQRTLIRLARAVDGLDVIAPTQFAVRVPPLPRITLIVGEDTLSAVLDVAPASPRAPTDSDSADAGLPTDAAPADARPAHDAAPDAAARPEGPEPTVGLTVTLSPARLATLFERRGLLPAGRWWVGPSLAVATRMALARLRVEPWAAGFSATVSVSSQRREMAEAIADIVADLVTQQGADEAEGGAPDQKEASSPPEVQPAVPSEDH